MHKHDPVHKSDTSFRASIQHIVKIRRANGTRLFYQHMLAFAGSLTFEQLAVKTGSYHTACTQ